GAQCVLDLELEAEELDRAVGAGACGREVHEVLDRGVLRDGDEAGDARALNAVWTVRSLAATALSGADDRPGAGNGPHERLSVVQIARDDLDVPDDPRGGGITGDDAHGVSVVA